MHLNLLWKCSSFPPPVSQALLYYPKFWVFPLIDFWHKGWVIHFLGCSPGWHIGMGEEHEACRPSSWARLLTNHVASEYGTISWVLVTLSKWSCRSAWGWSGILWVIWVLKRSSWSFVEQVLAKKPWEDGCSTSQQSQIPKGQSSCVRSESKTGPVSVALYLKTWAGEDCGLSQGCPWTTCSNSSLWQMADEILVILNVTKAGT